MVRVSTHRARVRIGVWTHGAMDTSGQGCGLDTSGQVYGLNISGQGLG